MKRIEKLKFSQVKYYFCYQSKIVSSYHVSKIDIDTIEPLFLFFKLQDYYFTPGT